MKRGLFLFVALLTFAAGAGEYWVDAENGSDANGGTSAQDAWLTLTNAAAHAKKSGDVIWALPGYYTNGTQVVSGQTTSNRVNLSGGVILRSTQGAKKTFILGAPSASDPDAYGRGTGATRCVYLQGSSKVVGFTITGGYTSSDWNDYSIDSQGGGVYCASGSGQVVDCIVSNNAAHASGAGHNLAFVRCRILNNLANNGAAGWSCSFYSSIINGNRIYSSDQACAFRYKYLYDSTFVGSGPNLKNGATSIMLREGTAGRIAYGCIFIAGPPGNEKLILTNCVYTTLSTQNPEFVPGDGCFKATAAEIALDADFRPTRSSVVLDKIATTDYDSAYTAAGDVDGGQRIYNGKRDMGAAEYDWCGVYAADLAKDSLAITNATANVVESESLKVKLVDGARLAGVWTPCGESRKFFATVTDEGAFTFAADGTTLRTVMAADGKTAIDLADVTTESPVTFSFAGAGSCELTRTAVQFTLPAEDEKAKLTVTGATVGETVVLNPGDTVTIAPNDSGTRMAAAIVVNGVTNTFADLPGGIWTYTVGDPAETNRVTLTAVTYTTDWYVDCENGVDSSDRAGISSNTAWKTLAYASAKVTTSGHRLIALPGHYRTGSVLATSGSSAPHIYSRVYVRSGVTLESRDGPDVTFIHGEAATADNGADDWGRGTNAIRCATVKGTLRGFTLLDGRTRSADGAESAYDANYRAGGAYGGTVKDCVISNCYGWCSTAGHGTTFVRCRIYDCWGTEYAAGWNCSYDDTIVDRLHDTCPGQWASIFQPYRVRNCTIGRSYYPSSGLEAYVIGEVSVTAAIFANNVILGNFGYTAASSKATNCVFVGSMNGMVLTETCWKSTEAALKLDADRRPAKDSPLVDAGCNRYVSAGEKDAYGSQRVYNVSNDIGAVEYDWRGDYATDLSKNGHFAVTEATTNVLESATNTLIVADGQSLTGAWTDAEIPSKARVRVRVVGAGTFTVTVGGETVATLAGPTAGPVFITFPVGAGGTVEANGSLIVDANFCSRHAVEFSYSEGRDQKIASTDGDAVSSGYAEIFKAGFVRGLVFMVR